MSKNKQSSVEWLINELTNLGYIHAPSFGHKIIDDKIEQAKAMHKQEIIDAVDGFPLANRNLEGTDYYNETFGGNK